MMMSLRMTALSQISTSSSVEEGDVVDAIVATRVEDGIEEIVVAGASAEIVEVGVDAFRMILEGMTIGNQHSLVKRMVMEAVAVAGVIAVTAEIAEIAVRGVAVESVVCKTVARADVANANQESR
jgi:hypothetical protein